MISISTYCKSEQCYLSSELFIFVSFSPDTVQALRYGFSYDVLLFGDICSNTQFRTYTWPEAPLRDVAF